MPKVSVVIPAYNRAHLIAETIQSVLAQSFQDFEIILVDSSSDNTREVVSRFPVIYFYQEKRGMSAARNTGIRLSSGQYIAFLDSDDLLLRHALAKGVEALDSYPEAGFSYGQAHLMDERGRIFGLMKSSFLKRSSIVDGRELISEMLSTFRVPMSTVMARRRCLDTIGGFDESMEMAEDLQLILRLAKKYSAAYVAQPLLKYRVHAGSISHNVDPRSAERAYLLFLKEIFEDAAIGPYFKPWRSKAYSNRYRFIADDAYGKDMKLARHYLAAALLVHPRSFLHKEGLSTAYMYAKSLLPNRFRLGLRDLKSHFCAPQNILGGKRHA